VDLVILQVENLGMVSGVSSGIFMHMQVQVPDGTLCWQHILCGVLRVGTYKGGGVGIGKCSLCI